MKTLYLLRHAKSSWDDPTADDHDRPLAPRGVRAARKVSTHMVTTGIRPDLVLCSSAQRTRDTLEALRPLGPHTQLHIEDELYGADADELLARLRTITPGTASVMLIGHNPGLHDLATDLAGNGNARALAELQTKFPTAAMAVLEFSGEWGDLDFGRAHLADVVLPRALPRPE